MDTTGHFSSSIIYLEKGKLVQWVRDVAPIVMKDATGPTPVGRLYDNETTYEFIVNPDGSTHRVEINTSHNIDPVSFKQKIVNNKPEVSQEVKSLTSDFR